MKTKFSLIYSLVICGFFNLNLTHHVFAPNFKNFEQSYKLAKDWAEKTYHDWIWNKLDAKESVAINQYTYKSSKLINQYLKQTKGNLITDSNLLPEKNLPQKTLDDLNKKILALDSGLKKVKIPENIIVYRRIDEQTFKLPVNILRDQNNLIRLDVFNAIKQKHLNREFINYNYISTSLLSYPLSDYNYINFPILMKIKLHKGNHAAYLSHLSYFRDELEMLLIRNLKIKYHQFSIIDEYTHQTLKIDASIVE